MLYSNANWNIPTNFEERWNLIENRLTVSTVQYVLYREKLLQ